MKIMKQACYLDKGVGESGGTLLFNKNYIKRKILKHSFLNKIIFFKKIDSTNKFLKENNFISGTIILAEEQTDGYGKLGARWISPRGGLWFSFVINKKIKNPIKHLKITAVAIVKTLKMKKINSMIKIPNDILINNKKVCGILLENDLYTGKLIIGIGLNVNNKIPGNTNIPAISVSEVLKKKIDLNKLFLDLITMIDRCFKKDKKIIEKYWKKYLKINLG